MELDTSDIRDEIIAEAEQYALRPPGPDEITVTMLVEQLKEKGMEVSDKWARSYLNGKVADGEYVKRENGISHPGGTKCHVYKKKENAE